MTKLAAFLAALALSAGTTLSAATFMEPPTDEEVSEAISEFTATSRGLERGDVAGRKKAAEEVAGQFNVAELSVDQLVRLNRAGIISLLEKREEALARLTELSKAPTGEGARAAVNAAQLLPSTAAGKKDDELKAAREADARARAAATVSAIRHPGFGELLKSGDADIFMMLSPYNAAGFAGMEEEVLTLARFLTEDLPPAVIARASTFYDFLGSEHLKVEPAVRENLRQKLVSLIDSASAELAADDRLRGGLERSRNYLNGAFARGTLMNNAAPDVEVLWTNAKEPINSLADLRGKVVVVDFWATWCGPCIGSFPQVRELVSHYEGYPVAVLGITSPQGYHINHKAEDQAARRIDTKGDEAKEFALMSEFVGQMDMTWPVVFTRQEVFNPEYGVRGIPHVAIIDPAGKVRYNGLHPGSPLEEKTKKINALLKEAGLPHPPEEEAPAKEDPTTASN